MKRPLLSVMIFSVVLSGCTDATNQRLDAMNNHMGTLTKQVDSYQAHVKALDDNSSRIAKETEAYEDLLRSLVKQAERIAQTMEQFQKMGENFSQQLQDVTKSDVNKNDPSAQPGSPTPNSPSGPGAAGVETTKTGAVRAEPVGPQIRLNESFCVTKNIHNLYDQITNYGGYSQMPGAKYNVPGIGILIQMVSSQASFSVRTPTYSTADAALVLQPITINDQKLFPNLVIHCDSKWNSEKVFEHQCFLDQSKFHFGLSNLISHLKAEAGGCDNGQTRVTYQLSLQTNESEVLMIKNKVVANFKVLGPIVAKLFNEELFFKAYFKNFYNSWIQSGN